MANQKQISTQSNRLRIAHALKLYYHRVQIHLVNLPDGMESQKEYYIKEATETMLMINKIIEKLGNSLDEHIEAPADEGILGFPLHSRRFPFHS